MPHRIRRGEDVDGGSASLVALAGYIDAGPLCVPTCSLGNGRACLGQARLSSPTA
jgi:hypothetical protein